MKQMKIFGLALLGALLVLCLLAAPACGGGSSVDKVFTPDDTTGDPTADDGTNPGDDTNPGDTTNPGDDGTNPGDDESSSDDDGTNPSDDESSSDDACSGDQAGSGGTGDCGQ